MENTQIVADFVNNFGVKHDVLIENAVATIVVYDEQKRINIKLYSKDFLALMDSMNRATDFEVARILQAQAEREVFPGEAFLPGSLREKAFGLQGD